MQEPSSVISVAFFRLESCALNPGLLRAQEHSSVGGYET